MPKYSQPEGLRSDEFLTYQAAYCTPPTSTRIVKDKATPFHIRAQHVYEQAVLYQREKFTLSWLIGMFKAFTAECDATMLSATTLNAKHFPTFHSQPWRAEIYVKDWYLDGVKYPSTHIVKLPNDSYFYSPNDDYNCIAVNQGHHYGDNWCTFQLDEIRETILPVTAYAKQYFQCKSPTTFDSKEIKMRVLHSFDQERLEIEYMDQKNKQLLIITFEPGYPETAVLADTWGSIE